MRTYEAVFILDERKIEDRGDSFARRVAGHIKDLGGKVQERQSLGRRQLAHPVKKHSSGVYWDFVLDLAPDKLSAFEDKYRLDETVLRLVVFHYNPPPPEHRRRTERRFSEH